jgi:hypothetical protein
MTISSILPPAETTFFDGNGNPLAGGFLYTYVPGTTTPKTTYQDSGTTIPNANPIVLDAAGRCICLGSGAYRTILQDSLGNQIWDQVTQNNPASTAMLPIIESASISQAEALWEQGITAGSAPTALELGQRWINNTDPNNVKFNVYDGASWITGATWDTVNHVWVSNGAAKLTASPVIATTPFGQGSQTIYVTSTVATTTVKTTQPEFAYSAVLTNATGGGVSISASGNKVAGYFATETQSGGGNGWAVNGLLQIDSGAAAIGGQQIAEWDMANNSGTDFGNALGFTGIEQPAIFGHQTTAVSTNLATAAHVILGNISGTNPAWNNGMVAGPFTISQNFLADYSSAYRSILISGAHVYGIDMAGQTGQGANPALRAIISGSAIRIGNQDKISIRNLADNADLTALQSTSTDQLVVGGGFNDVVIYSGSNIELLANILSQNLAISTSYANDTAAAAGGVALYQFYRNGSVVQIRVT